MKTPILRKRRLSKNTKESYATEQRGNGAFSSSRILHNAPNVTPINAADAVSCFEKTRPIMKPKTIATQMMKGMAAGLKHVFPVCWYLVYLNGAGTDGQARLPGLGTAKLNRYLKNAKKLLSK